MKCIAITGLLLLVKITAVKAQDLSVINSRVMFVKDVATLMITVKNNDSIQLKINAELNIDFMNDSAKMIYQIQLQTMPLKAWGQQLFQIPFHAFHFNNGFSLKQVKKVLVLCDPQNKIKETNEANNVYEVPGFSGLQQAAKKQKTQSETQF